MTINRAAMPGFPASRNDFETLITNFSGTSAGLTAGHASTIVEHLTNYNKITLGQPFDGSGSVIPVNQTLYIPCAQAGTIVGYDLFTPDSGSATVKVWKKATGNTIPTSADSISTSGLTITTASDGKRKISTTVTDFTTTAVTADDLFGYTITAVSSLTRLYFVLYIARTNT